MQSQRHTSAPAACCRVWGAGWERLHLGKTGGGGGGAANPLHAPSTRILPAAACPLFYGPSVLSSPGQQHQSLSWSSVLHVRGHGGSVQQSHRPRLPGALPALGAGRAGARTAFVCQHTRAGEEASRGDKSRMAKQRAGVNRAW